MHVDGALVDIDAAAPDAVEKLVAREHPARALHQELEQLELGRAEMKLATAAAHPARLAVELDVARGEEMGDMRRLRPPQQGAHPGEELRHRKRLRDVVVSTGRESSDAIALLAARRQHDDRQALGLSPETDASAQ